MHLKCYVFNTAYQGIQDHSEVMKEDVKELDGRVGSPPQCGLNKNNIHI